MNFSEDQEIAIDKAVNSRRHIIIDGKAGTGKSAIVQEIIKRRPRFGVSATTGIAGLNIGGVTVDKMFGINRLDWSIRTGKTLSETMRVVGDAIIVDEASMVGYEMAECLNEVSTDYGKRLILIGDWAQAAPVKDDWAFESPLFQYAERVTLTTNHRQVDPEYRDALDNIRQGVADDYFLKCVEEPEEDTIRLFALNKLVKNHNQLKLQEHIKNTKAIIFTLNASMIDRRKFKRYPLKNVIENSRLAHDAMFAIGSRVMINRNDPESAFYNGDIGTIVGVDGTESPSSIVIELDRGTCVRLRKQHIDVYNARKQLEATVSGFPLQLGWALSIHKSQGSTLDKACLDMDSIKGIPTLGRHGLAYVGLSRTKTIEGLSLTSYNGQVVYCDPTVKDYFNV